MNTMTVILGLGTLLAGFVLGFTLHFLMSKMEDAKTYTNGFRDGMQAEFKIIYEIILKSNNQNK